MLFFAFSFADAAQNPIIFYTTILRNKHLSTLKKIVSTFRADIGAAKADERKFGKIFCEAEVDESYLGGKRKRGFGGKLKKGPGTLARECKWRYGKSFATMKIEL